MMATNEDMAPMVSVIVPCYNCGKYLAETLNSVISQTNSNWECIIIDDGSTDDSRHVADGFIQKDKRFKYIYQANQGVANARNNAIRNAAGKYILPLDGDDKIAHEYIDEAVRELGKDSTVKLIYSKAETFGERSGFWNIPAYSYKELLIENLIFCSAVFRKEDFLKTKGYDESMREGFEDWEFWIAFLTETDKVIQLPKVNFYYRLRGISRNPKTTEAEKQKRIRNYIFQKHSDLYQKYFSLPNLLFEYYQTKIMLESVENSTSFRVGKTVMAPLIFIKKLFQ